MGKISDIAGFRINYGHFVDDENKFELFPSNGKKRVALVYGRNGSGKTTIANAIRKINEKGFENNLKFYDEDNKDVDIVTNDNKFFYVFDEEYIDNKVKFNQDKLGTIVLFGEQLNIEERINKIDEGIEKFHTVKKGIEEDLKKLSDKTIPDSIPDLETKVLQILKNRWAIYDQQLKGNKIATSVSKKVLEKIIETMPPRRSLPDLNKEYQEKSVLLKSAMNTGQIISNKLPDLSDFFSLNFSETRQIVLKPIEKPTFTQREQDIIKLFEGQMEKLTKSANYLNDSDDSICELCLQPIPNDYRQKVIFNLEKIKTVEFDKQIQQIRDLLLDPLDENIFNGFQSVNFSRISQLMQKIKHLNTLVTEHNRIIYIKVNNPYKSIDYPYEQQFQSLIKVISNLIHELDLSRNLYNDAINSSKQFVDDLKTMNDQIAFLEVKDLYDNLREKNS